VRLRSHREDQYDVTDSSWVSLRFKSRVFRFHSTDDDGGRHKMVSQIPRLMLCIDFRGRGLLHKIFAFLSILVPVLCILYHNLYWMFSCYLPSSAHCLRYLRVYSCSYPDVDSLSSERMLNNANVQLGKKIGRESRGVCRQDELICGKPPVVK
jgi:hypothetical protein